MSLARAILSIRTVSLAVLTIGFIACLSAQPAWAQFGFGGDAPILVNAEKATYKGNLTVLEGNVDVRQGETQILSDTMDLYRAETPASASGSLQLGEVNRIDAKGNFRYISPENVVTGNRGVYQRLTGIITVTGNVKVTQPSGNIATTETLTYNVKTDTIRFGDNCIGDDCESEGRATLRINP